MRKQSPARIDNLNRLAPVKTLANNKGFFMSSQATGALNFNCGGRMYNNVLIIEERNNHGFNVIAYGQADKEWKNVGHFQTFEQAVRRAEFAKCLIRKANEKARKLGNEMAGAL